MSEKQILVNGCFRGQRTTGQQRYATEIADRLVHYDGVDELAPPQSARGSVYASWGYAQWLAVKNAASPLISLTSRAPVARRRHVLVVHDLFVLTNAEWFSRKYVVTHAPMLKAQIRSADMVVAVSPQTADRVREFFGDREVTVAPNAPSGVFMSESTEARTRPVAMPDGPFLLAVGSRDPRKNFGRLVEAYSGLPQEFRKEYRLVIAGGASSLFASSHQDRGGDATALGYVTDAELAWLYSHAAGVVFPSLDEGFGLPAVEALAVGANLAVSDIPVFRWLCGEYATYFDPLSTTGIARALVEIVGRTPHHEAPARIRERFDWDESARLVHRAAAAVS